MELALDVSSMSPQLCTFLLDKRVNDRDLSGLIAACVSEANRNANRLQRDAIVYAFPDHRVISNNASDDRWEFRLNRACRSPIANFAIDQTLV